MKLMAGLQRRGYEPGPYESFARVPKGYEPDHPRAELLKYKGLICGIPAIPVRSLAPAEAGALAARPREGDSAAGDLAAPESGIAALDRARGGDGPPHPDPLLHADMEERENELQACAEVSRC